MQLLLSLILWWCGALIPNGKVDILLVGDSISHVWTWSSELNNNRHINLTRVTKNGATTDWGLENLKREYKKPYPPHILIIYLGVNDVWGGRYTHTGIQNIQKMVELSNQHCGYPIIVTGIKTTDAAYTRYQTELQKLKFLSPVWITKPIPNRGYLRSDGVHLTPAGNVQIGLTVKSSIGWVLIGNPILKY